MAVYRCKLCGWKYNEDNKEGKKWRDVEENFKCPICGAGKDRFEKLK